MAETLEVRVKLDDRASRQLKNIDDAIKKLDGRMGGLSTSSVAAGTGLGNLASRATVAKVGIAAVGVAAVATTRAILESARAYENTVNQLNLVTKGTDDYNKTIARLQTLASQNRTSFDATVELYTKLRVATDDLGYSTSQVEDLTTKLSQALAVAGADAGTANGVIRQFGQAMASGVVRGDEFNSIVEGLGPALNIMARESGINVGKLREMAQNGELTAEVFADMLLNSNALAESFNKLAPTMDQVDTRLGDSLTNLGAAIDRYFGLSEAVKAVKTEAAELADGLAGALAPKTDLEILQDQAKMAQDEIDRLKTSILTLGTGIGGSSQDLMSGLGAFMNPNASETELKRAQAVARAGSMPNDAIILNQALKDQEAILNNLQTRIDALQAAKKRDIVATIAAAEAAEVKRLADEAEKARIAELDAIYGKYAMSRTRAAETQRELIKAQQEQNAELEKLLRNNESALTTEQQARLAYDEKKQAIRDLNEQLRTNTTLTDAQRNQIYQTIDGLKSETYQLADLIKGGELYNNIILEQQQALRNNAAERDRLTQLVDDQIMKLSVESANTEENRRQLELLNQALRDNLAARDELLGRPMSVETLTARVNETLVEAQANRDLLAAYKEAGANAIQLAEAKRILGIATEASTRAGEREQQTYNDFYKDLEFNSQAHINRVKHLQTAQKALNKLVEKGGDNLALHKKMLDEVNKGLEAIGQTTKDKTFNVMETLEQRMESLVGTISNSLTDVVMGAKSGFDALKDIANSVLRTIVNTLIEAQIRKMFFNTTLSGGMGSMSSLLGMGGGLGALGIGFGIGGLLGGFFADGGTVHQSQKPIVVGERGPELFLPGRAGTVVANEDLNMGSGEKMTVNFNINAIDTQTGTQFIVENEDTITGLIQRAYNRRGEVGPLG